MILFDFQVFTKNYENQDIFIEAMLLFIMKLM